MANPEIINNDRGKPPVFNPKYEDAVLEFTGADTYAEGVLMAQVIAGAVTVVADVGNTGDGTVTGQALAAGGPARVGAWNFEVTAAVVNGGVFKLEDPDANLVASDLTIPAGAGNTLVVTVGGLTFTVTDGTTDFIVGDKFAISVADGGHKWRPFVEGAVNGLGSPSGILPQEAVATGAEDQRRRMLIGGEVDENYLSRDDANPITAADKSNLRDAGIIVRKGLIIDELDNQ
jgi:hypothetical protein